MSQPTTVREYSGPRPEQPGAGPLITFPESHGLPVRLAASGWLGILCLPGSEFRARIAVGESRQNTSFGGPLSRSGLVGTGDVFFSNKSTALGTKPSTDGPAPCLCGSWSPDGMAMMMNLCAVGLKMAPLAICEKCGVVQVRPLERNCWSNHGHCF